MNVVICVLGVALVILVFWDVLSTTLLLRGGGKLSLPLAHLVWRCAMAVHRSLRSRGFLCFCGVFTLVATIAFWIVGYWLGWTLIFSVSPQSVVAAKSELPASLIERAYYVGFTFITLGIGDYKAGSLFWQIITILLSISGFFLVTLVITYLIPVVSATVEQRQLAVFLNSFSLSKGGPLNSPGDAKIVEHLGRLSSLNMQICRLSQLHLAYPILQFMQARDHKASSPLALAELDEMLTLVLHGGTADIPVPRESLLPLRNALTIYLSTMEAMHIPMQAVAPEPPSLQSLAGIGYRVIDGETYRQRINRLENRRRMLNSLITYSGWNWRDIGRRGQGTDMGFHIDRLSSTSAADPGG